jgi:hypothetical protein
MRGKYLVDVNKGGKNLAPSTEKTGADIPVTKNMLVILKTIKM